MISDDTARALVRDGILEKTLEGKPLSDGEKSALYEQALVDWAARKRAAMELAKKVRREKAAKEAATHAPAQEKPLGV